MATDRGMGRRTTRSREGPRIRTTERAASTGTERAIEGVSPVKVSSRMPSCHRTVSESGYGDSARDFSLSLRSTWLSESQLGSQGDV
jgi:hypothetical protein